MNIPSGARPLDGEELAFAGVTAIADRLREGTVTSRGLVELFLRRIERLDGRLSAFTTVLAASARAEADAADRLRARARPGEPLPPLLGVPIAVKDNLDVRGVPTRFGTGSPELPAAFDAEIVRRLRQAGCVILGKTTMPELALLPFGPARNPWDPSRTAGGSSSGSAAAVAAGLVPAATGSDGGGSIRMPAALCGLVGLKPTPDLVPLTPDAEHWGGLSAAGFLTRTVQDTVALLDAVLGSTLAAAVAEPLPPLRIGVLRSGAATPRPVPLDPEVESALQDAARTFAELGHPAGPVPLTIGSLQSTFVPRYLRGARDDQARLVEPRAVGPTTRTIARLGSLITDRQVATARRRGNTLRNRLLEQFGTVDVLLSPTVPTPAWEHDRLLRAGRLPTMLVSSEKTIYTAPWNVAGFPAVSVPAGCNRAGLPLAVQLIGPPNTEARLLGLAAALERSRTQPVDAPT